MEGSGPWVSLAAFCRDFRRDEGGGFDRVDFARVVIVPTMLGLPTDDPPPVVRVTFLLDLRTDRSHGAGPLTILARRPSGIIAGMESVALDLSEPGLARGIDQVVNVVFAEEGVYWFDVFFGETLLTRVPLGVRSDASPGRPG